MTELRPDPAGAVVRHLDSRKNIAGMVGALVGVALHLAGLVGDIWPVVVIGLYAMAALIGPRDPVEGPTGEPGLTDVLRAEAEAQLERVERRRAELPVGAEHTVRHIVRTVRLVLDRLDEVAEDAIDRIAAPERLADAAEIVRVDLSECLDVHLRQAAPTPPPRAVRELAAQLQMIRERADGLAAQVPDVRARRAEELTREMRRRHGQGR